MLREHFERLVLPEARRRAKGDPTDLSSIFNLACVILLPKNLWIVRLLTAAMSSRLKKILQYLTHLRVTAHPTFQLVSIATSGCCCGPLRMPPAVGVSSGFMPLLYC